MYIDFLLFLPQSLLVFEKFLPHAEIWPRAGPDRDLTDDSAG